MLVVARKFNDIFYAMSTLEWNQVEKHDLLIISEYLKKEEFPLVEVFDSVFVISGSVGKMSVAYELYNVVAMFSGKSYRYVTTCNLAHVSHLLLLRLLKGARAILLEDGLMNYYHFKTSQRFTKRIVKFLCGVNEESVLKKVCKTYLLQPEDAIYYYGYPSKLNIAFACFINKLQFDIPINNKKIFVGQPLYLDRSISIEEYSKIVNELIEKYEIDYYLPHRTYSPSENIKCEILNLSAYKITLEVLASCFQFDVYGFSSSLLYTTKMINPNIRCYAITQRSCVNSEAVKYILEHVDVVLCN